MVHGGGKTKKKKEFLRKVDLAVYSLMVLRVFFSFFTWIGMMFFSVVAVCLQDMLDGFIPWMAYKKKVREFKQKMDYSTDGVSRLIMLVPLFMFHLPFDVWVWFILLYVWYYISIFLRIFLGSIEAVMLTCPINFILFGWFLLPMLGLPLFPLIIAFVLGGIVYNVFWHSGLILGYRH